MTPGYIPAGGQNPAFFAQRHRPAQRLQNVAPLPAHLATQPVIGHWYGEAASIVGALLQTEGRRSMLAFAQAAGARRVKGSGAPANISTPTDPGRSGKAGMERNDGI